MKYHRLEKLAAFLEVLPRNVFNISGWVQMPNPMVTATKVTGRTGILKTNLTPEVAKECGFAACAVGWACTMPSNRRAGLTMKDGQPNFDGSDNWDAVERFFDLGPREASHLFNGALYPSYSVAPKMVAKRIRAMVAEQRG